MWLEENKCLNLEKFPKSHLRTFTGYLDLKLGGKKEVSVAIVTQLARSRSRNWLLVFCAEQSLIQILLG